MANMISTPKPEKSWMSQWGAVLAVMIISLIATVLISQYEKKRVADEGQARFERSSEILKDDIVNTVNAYAQFLRGAVGLVHASEQVSREEWWQYVSDARMEENFPAIQGVSINGFVQGQAEREVFLADIRQRGFPDYQIKPEGTRDIYAPVMFLQPMSQRNEEVTGYDIYSEGRRREAIETAIRTGEPTMTAKVTLVQETEDTVQDGLQAGVLLILPTYDLGALPNSAMDRVESTNSLITSVFRMGDLINSVYAARNETPHQRIRLDLYDADRPDPQAQMYGDTYTEGLVVRDALFKRLVTLDVYGRKWTFEMASSQEFEDEAFSDSPTVVFGAGILVTMLLTSLVWGQSQSARETELAAEKLAFNQQHIELLMGEVNHRSKNLLSLVQAIARQTKADDPSQFVSQFSERVRALAASQDLLVKNSWKGISLNDLIDSQLAHFEGLLGDRIQLNGPDIDVSAEASQTLGMAFHELATNAGKYGALSNAVGTVDIEWKLTTRADQTDHLEIAWLESGGPPVVKPTHKGFGTKVTDMMVKFSLAGTVVSSFEPTGFMWRLSCPTSRLFEDPRDPISTRIKDREIVL